MDDPIEMRRCPGCDWAIGTVLWDRVVFDFECGRCRQHRLSEFVLWPPRAKPETDETGD